jgi:YcaO-like protein with predicted kinase domain
MAIEARIADALHRISEVDFSRPSDAGASDEDVRRLVEAIAITRMASTTGLDRLNIPTAYCVRPAAMHPCAVYSSGKAFEPRRAELSAVFECYERWAAERPAFCVEASLDDLIASSRGNDLAVFEPPDVDVGKTIAWALGRSFGATRYAAVPACYVEFPPAVSDGQKFTTTGLAAHASFAEAASNALLECIERDRTAALPRSNLVRVGEENFSALARDLAATFAREEIELHTFVIDPGPHFRTAYCYAYDHWLGVPQIHCSGFGASTCLELAVEKAMLEVVQSRAAMISGLRADVAGLAARGSHDYREISGHRAWLEKLRCVTPVLDRSALTNEVEEKLPDVLAGMISLGLTPLVFPLRPAAGFPAVRAFVPELNDCC